MSPQFSPPGSNSRHRPSCKNQKRWQQSPNVDKGLVLLTYSRMCAHSFAASFKLRYGMTEPIAYSLQNTTMPTLPLIGYTGFLLVMFTTTVFAEDRLSSQAIPTSRSQEFDQILYKGLVGNVLDALPMDPTHRLNLQRTNAVVSNTLSGHSLTMLTKLANPALLIGGIVWGLWAASNIKAPAAAAAVRAATESTSVQVEEDLGMNADASTPHIGNADFATRNLTPVSVAMHTAAETSARVVPRSPVIKIWISQPSN